MAKTNKTQLGIMVSGYCSNSLCTMIFPIIALSYFEPQLALRVPVSTLCPVRPNEISIEHFSSPISCFEPHWAWLSSFLEPRHLCIARNWIQTLLFSIIVPTALPYLPHIWLKRIWPRIPREFGKRIPKECNY